MSELPPEAGLMLPAQPLTDAQRDALIRVLSRHHEHLAEQIAEVAVSQRQVEDRLVKGDERMTRIEAALAENTGVTTQVLELINTFKGGFKLAGWLGTLVGWVGKLAAGGGAVYGLWYLIKHGKPPGG